MTDNLFGREGHLVNPLEHRRQRALDTLSQQYARGFLDETEFEHALQEVRSASSETVLATTLERYASPATPDALPDSSQTVYAILSERNLKGDWLTSHQVTATTVMGDMTLDLREMVLTEDTHIHTVTIMGELTILLPPEIAVDNRISAVLAELNDTRASRGGGAGPTLHLTGTALLAEVSLR